MIAESKRLSAGPLPIARMCGVIEVTRFDGGPRRRPQGIHACRLVENLGDVTAALEHGDADPIVLDRDGSASLIQPAHDAHHYARGWSHIAQRWECQEVPRSLVQSKKESKRETPALHYAKRRALICCSRGYIVPRVPE
jgi:hypothetical protein